MFAWETGIFPSGVTLGEVFIDGGKSEMHPEVQSVRKTKEDFEKHR
jgi:hypothetical protein